MAVVFSSDLSDGSISSIISMLESEADDAQSLIDAINSFIEGTRNSLTGKAYDMARQKMSMYTQDLKVRKQIAMDLAKAISQGASSLLEYMEEFFKLDDSAIIELENEIRKLDSSIYSARGTIKKIMDNSEEDDQKFISYYRSQINYWENTKKDLERKLEKLVNLASADRAAFARVEAVSNQVEQYGASIDGISISSIV